MAMIHREARRRAVALELGTCLAIDAGCLAVSGAAGLLAFGVAWLVLKGSGVI